ncbi:MAG TPA: phosphatase PAP2 family protein, partial [Miltoncostaeaceae bacterium]|nr:phosphatase PAP2 family protein [Miltoncostaeaceae bacterium]
PVGASLRADRTRHLLAAADRRLGATLRRRLNRWPTVALGARWAADALSPAFRALVVVLIARPPTRAIGLRAGAAAVAGALVARALRARIGRRRPGARREGGFPSRHATAAVAIVWVLGHADRRWRFPLGASAALGLAGRVLSADHEPADVVAGAALGATVGACATRIRWDR